MKQKSRGGIILVVIGLVLISMTMTLGRSFSWSDSLRGIVTGVAVGLEVLGLVVLLRGMPGKQEQA